MTANQIAITASTGYTANWCRVNARKLNLSQRLLLAFQIATAKKSEKFGRNYNFNMAGKETAPFDPDVSAVKYYLYRVV